VDAITPAWLYLFSFVSGGERKKEKGSPGQSMPKRAVQEPDAGDSDSMTAQLLY